MCRLAPLRRASKLTWQCVHTCSSGNTVTPDLRSPVVHPSYSRTGARCPRYWQMGVQWGRGQVAAKTRVAICRLLASFKPRQVRAAPCAWFVPVSHCVCRAHSPCGAAPVAGMCCSSVRLGRCDVSMCECVLQLPKKYQNRPLKPLETAKFSRLRRGPPAGFFLISHRSATTYWDPESDMGKSATVGINKPATHQ